MNTFCEAVSKGQEIVAIEVLNQGRVDQEVACGAVRVSAEKGMNLLVQGLFREFVIPVHSMVPVLEVYKNRNDCHMVRTILTQNPNIDPSYHAKIAEICKAMKLWDLVGTFERSVSEDECFPWFSKKG